MLSTRIEEEQTRKLQQLGGRGSASSSWQSRPTNGHGGDDTDFESLVSGRRPKANGVEDDSWDIGWGDDESSTASSQYRPQKTPQSSQKAAIFSRSTPVVPTTNVRNLETTRSQVSRTVTPDNSMSSFAPLAPSRPGQQNTARSSQNHSQPMSTSRQQPLTSNSSGNYSNWPSMSDTGNPWESSQAPPVPGRPQASAPNPWTSVDTSNHWGGQTNGLPSSFNNMRISPPKQGSSVGAFEQTQQKTNGGLDNWGSLL